MRLGACASNKMMGCLSPPCHLLFVGILFIIIIIMYKKKMMMFNYYIIINTFLFSNHSYVH